MDEENSIEGQTPNKRRRKILNGAEDGKNFTSENQPTPEQKSKGWGRRKTLKKILEIKIADASNYSLLQQIKDKIPDLELSGISFDEAMDMVMISRTLLKGDVGAYSAVKDRRYGKPSQAIDFTGDVKIKVVRK